MKLGRLNYMGVAVPDLHAAIAHYRDAMGASDFTEPFLLDTSDSGGPSAITGPHAAVAIISQAIATTRTAHQVHTAEIVLTSETARAIQDRLVFDNDHGATGYGHYSETYEKHGQLKIASSTLPRLLVEPMTALA